MGDLNRFVANYSGQKADANGNTPNQDAYAQCVDIVNLWLKSNGLPPIYGRNAIDFVTAPGYRYVKNTSSYVPPAGSIAIFALGKYGHVAIVLPGTTVTDLLTFDQNYPVGSACKKVNHRNYAGVKGFLVLQDSAPAKTYKVVSGDTLSKIGTKLGVAWQKIAEKNGIRAPYLIHSGQILQIP